MCIFEFINPSTGVQQSSGDNTEKLEFPIQGDTIMTATIYNEIPIFFTRLHGLVSISSSDFENDDFFNK